MAAQTTTRWSSTTTTGGDLVATGGDLVATWWRPGGDLVATPGSSTTATPAAAADDENAPSQLDGDSGSPGHREGA